MASCPENTPAVPIHLPALSRVLCAFSCAAGLAAQTPSTDVAVGVFPFLVGNMDGRIQEIVLNCQTRGIDTLYVSVFRATGPQQGSLWIDDRAGSWNPAWGPVRPGGAGIDLTQLIAACRAVNLRVVGILKCFDATVQPTHALHKQYLLDIVDYLIDSYRPDGRPVYDLDGLALDYVRFVGSTTGNDPQQVTRFVADVRSRLKGLSLHCYLVASRYTFDGGTYNGNFQPYATVIQSLASQYGQHWEQMAMHADVLMPMAYTADGPIYNTYGLHQAYVRQTAAYARTACALGGYPGRRVCPTIRTYTDAAETTTDQTIQASITGALLGGADGFQAFRYQHLVGNPTWWNQLQQYAVPGCNWPVPECAITASSLTATFDATASRDLETPSSVLQVRFDIDGDGRFDTGWLGNTPHVRLCRHPGTWTLSMQVRDGDGHVVATRRRYDAGPALQLVPQGLFAGFGGTVQIHLDAGPAAAGASYLMLGTLSGTTPGFLWRPGFPVPIQVDFLTEALAASPNNPLLSGGLGVLDAGGRATAVLQVPPGLLAVLAGSTLHWAFLAADGLGLPACVSEADPLLIMH